MGMQIKLTLLGTGTSQGIPVLGCSCSACISDDPRDKRLRCSLLIESLSSSIIIDVGPDFRQQMLRTGTRKLQAVFLTHEHNDHLIGLDDLRPYIFRSSKAMAIYGEERVLEEVKSRFAYAFEGSENAYPGAPEFELCTIAPGDQFVFDNIRIRAERIYHGKLPILGYVINDQLAYFTDTNKLGPELIERYQGIQYLILDMLREKKHHSHFNLEEAIRCAQQLQARSTYLIHMSHYLGPTSAWEHSLPEQIYPGMDGQVIEL